MDECLKFNKGEHADEIRDPDVKDFLFREDTRLLTLRDQSRFLCPIGI